MEHLLQKSKCFSFHIFKYMMFQMRQKAVLWSKGLMYSNFMYALVYNLVSPSYSSNMSIATLGSYLPVVNALSPTYL